MFTLDELQKLDDGKFHRLCDDLFHRLEPRYRQLRPHGINPQGVSIKGQPDSYVGATANTCQIAFAYSVQRKSWWIKMVQDIEAVIEASSGVEEIVVATSRDVDREGPKLRKKKKVDWLSPVRTAAGKTKLWLVDGRDISGYLDRDHQDLRFEHLRIPYSRLSWQSILASCRQVNAEAIAELVASGRYDPRRYAPRDADRELYGLLQRALRPADEAGSLGKKLIRLIPLVNDSGVGKTSLLAAFTRSLDSVILVQGRNLGFASEDSLVTHVIQALQGVLDPKSHLEEEAAIVRHLPAGTLFTVVLDGLDEARDTESVRRAVSYWLKSKLGQVSVLVVSSRPEFWKRCVDRVWTHWMPKDGLDNHSPKTVASRSSVEGTDPADGIRLPDRFSEAELEVAWVRAGRSLEQFFILPVETRDELRHPFTLRVYLDLCSATSAPSRLSTRAELLEAWLKRRLDAETVPSEYLTRQQYQAALRFIATRLADLSVGSLSVDDLAGVPRFDATRPPGPVVERLVAANILESVPGHSDQIRFAVQAVQDFYRAEAEVEMIISAPTQVAERFANLPFTEAYPRLSRIGKFIVKHEVRHKFVEHLADANAQMAATVLRTDPTRYGLVLRQKVVKQLGQQIESRHRVRSAFAIGLLSDLKSEEATECLASHLLPPATPHPYLESVGAMAFARLGYIGGVGLVYRWPRFGLRSGGVSDYFKEMLAFLRGAPAQFKEALARYAWERLAGDSGTNEHGRAVVILSYLGDERIAEHLNERLSRNGTLQIYENHALVALGTDTSGEIFRRSAMLTSQRIRELGYEDGSMEWYRLHSLVCYPSGDYPILLTPQFGVHVTRLTQGDNDEAAFMGFNLAMRSRRPELILPAVRAWTRWKWLTSTDHHVRNVITPDEWLGWWNSTGEVPIRRRFLWLLPIIPNAEIEALLIDILDDANYRSKAAWCLGHMGCCRSAAYLRQMLEKDTASLKPREMQNAALALGLMRDTSSVEQLRLLALAHPKTEEEFFAVLALGLIGTSEAEAALNTLLGTEVDESHVAGALLCCGSPTAVEKVVGMARSRQDGTKWLSECLSQAFWPNSRRHLNEFYTHISTGGLVDYLATTEGTLAGEGKWALVHALEKIDSEEVRQLLRQWASRVGSAADAVVRDDDQLRMSFLCFDQLMMRGDPFAIRYFLDYRSDEEDDIYVALASENLNHFAREPVAVQLRDRLASASNPSQAVRLLSLLGRFGDGSDEKLIYQFLDDPDELVANVACESLLRLTDPMLVPDNWREI